jgi:hypothetical protein
LCEVNTSIRIDARRYGISYWQLEALHREYHEINGCHPPDNLVDLLEVVC